MDLGMDMEVRTYRNKVLSSLNPSAKARTASLLPAPKSRRANIALYRSNSGNEVFKSAVLNSGMDWGAEEGAGSIVGKSGLVSESAIDPSDPQTQRDPVSLLI